MKRYQIIVKPIAMLIFAQLMILSCNHSSYRGKLASSDTSAVTGSWAIVIHGGAGSLTRENITPVLDSLYRESLADALDAGKKVLERGGSSIDAVEQTINIMEDNPLFNAGKGAVFAHDGKNELDAAIMDGSNLAAGAVACVTDIKNPVSAARKVMTESPHVLLTGIGASQFAREHGLEIVPPEYFYTDRRFNELQEILKKEKMGTVGCVALDKAGNLAAGTSTGGMPNKKYNRVGDSPIIGAGTYANNRTCAVSATGHGEFFIRLTVAYDISALMEYKGLSVREASEVVINDKLVRAGGSGGVICLDRRGNVAMTFNSSGMFRGYATSEGKHGIFIYKNE
jgi:L-asparaginase / beta-aspartyl-peptidase